MVASRGKIVIKSSHKKATKTKEANITITATDPTNAAVMAFREIAELACRREDWLIILHAGSVAWQDQGVIFPSSGGAGKTTLTAALIRHGFDYINDDVIPVERNTGKLIPVPISLCIKSDSWPLLQHFYPELENLRSFGRNNGSGSNLKFYITMLF